MDKIREEFEKFLKEKGYVLHEDSTIHAFHFESFQAGYNANKWLPIESMPPETEGLVFTTNKEMFVAYYDGKLFKVEDPRGGGSYILAATPTRWQLLQTPPEEDL